MGDLPTHASRSALTESRSDSALREHELFRPLLHRLRPSPEAAAAATLAAGEVTGCLDRAFADLAAVPATRAAPLVVGGLAKGTAVAPGRVVDCLYLLPAHVRHRAWPGARSRRGDMGFVGALVAGLARAFPSAHLTPAGWIAVETASGIVVRLLPAVPREAGGYRLARPATGMGLWHETNPAAELALLQRVNRVSRGKATHLVMLLKAWRRANGVPIHSVALERLAVEFVPQWPYRRRSLLFYDWMVRDFFFWAAHQGGRRVPLPGTDADFDLGDGWVFDAEAAFAFAKRAGRLGSLGRTAEATDHWCRLFGQPLELLLGRAPTAPAVTAAGDMLSAPPPVDPPLLW